MKGRAHGHLSGILHLLNEHKGKPSKELLEQIQTSVKSAVDALLEHDELKQKIAFILIAIKQSTNVKIVNVHNPATGKFDKPRTRVTVIDATLYEWAIHRIHTLAD